jgi:hypothetical protein
MRVGARWLAEHSCQSLFGNRGADDEPEMSRREIPSVTDREIYG